MIDVRCKIKKVPSADILNKIFEYDESSPSGLFWKLKPKYGPTKIGDIAGTLNNRGYWCVSVSSVDYLVHRIIYEMKIGKVVDDFVVDHLDGDTSNNRICNLRLVTLDFNKRNQKMSKNNTSGVTGVKLQKTKTKSGFSYIWVAQVGTGKSKRRSKSFSCTKYGNNKAFELACNWRESEIILMNLDNPSYTERHGKPNKVSEPLQNH